MAQEASRMRLGAAVLAAALLALGLLSGCVVHHHDDHHLRVVKVPRERRHGYDRHHHGVVLVFDGTWSGYRVRGRPHHYFYHDVYYRWHGRRWYRARRPGGPWSWMRVRSLPMALAAHHERTERHDARRDRRQERRESRRDHREDRQESRREHREDRQEARQDRREDRQEVRQDRRGSREERREARQDNGEKRREARRDDGEKRRAKKKSKDWEQVHDEDAYESSVPANQADDD